MEQSAAFARWKRILPVAFVTYSLAYLDRVNFGFGAAAGMADDLHITKNATSILSALFFLGYFTFQIPGTHYASNKSSKKLIFWSLVFWGLCAMLTGMVSNITVLTIVRFMLGVVESAVFPSMLVLLSRWFTREERSRANTLLILGNPITVLWGSIVSGYLIQLAGWRGMFILEGLPTIIWAFLWWRLIDDKPSDAKWLPAAEKEALESALAKEQQGIKPVKDYAAAFRSPTVILLALQYATWSIGIYGFVMWLPSIIKAAPSMDMVKTGWLSSLPYIFAALAMFGSSYYSDKSLIRREYVWPFLLFGAIAFYGSYLVGTDNFWLSFALLTIAGASMYAPYGPFFAMITELLPRNVAGGAIALINSFGALGSFLGTWFVGWLNNSTGNFGASYIFMAGSLFLSAVLTIVATLKKAA